MTQRNFKDFNVSEIVKCGSLGHGTGLKDKSDLDLVIYSRGKPLEDDTRPLEMTTHLLLNIDITQHDVLSQGENIFKKWLDMLDSFLMNHLGKSYDQTEMTNRSVQFNFKGMEVDLLVSPFFENPTDFYKFLKSVHHSVRDRYESSVVLQVSGSEWALIC